MNAQITLLIADRNPHVREFLKRELLVEGYHIRLASTGREILEYMSGVQPDILILDPDMPDIADISLIERIHRMYPQMPVVVHSLMTDIVHQLDDAHPIVFVEKQGSSIDHLKQAIKGILDPSSSKFKKTQ